MLTVKYGIPEESAPILFGLPYIISACTSPFIGFMLDKVGYRAHFSKLSTLSYIQYVVTLSTILLGIGHFITMLLRPCDGCYSEVFPLVLIGLGYSLFAAALWAAIPYVVEARTVGTAFGITTAI